MNLLSIRNRLLIVSVASVFHISSGNCQCLAQSALPPSPPPTLKGWIATKLTDPLQKPPFAAAPPASLKGLAAQIRAAQLDIPNRIKACQYLGTVDCVTYPKAQEMLIATMEEDPAEVVRYEAVMALRNMLTHGCCNMDTACLCESCCNRKKIVRETEAHARKGKRAIVKEAKCAAKKAAIKANRQAEAEDERYDCCRGCANEKVMKALAEVATAKDDQCCFVEPSERVRQAASEAMCLFPNLPDGYGLPETSPEPVPGTDDETKGDSEAMPPKQTDEAKPDSMKDAKESEAPSASASRKSSLRPTSTTRVIESQDVETTPISSLPPLLNKEPALPPLSTSIELPILNTEPQRPSMPVIPGLKGQCIVAMKTGQLLPVDPQYSSIYQERTYHFSSAMAKAEFDQNPKKYALAYGGFDPVVWLAERRMIDGQILREYNGQFFLFTCKENWEVFQSNPQRYVLKTTAQTKIQTVSNQY